MTRFATLLLASLVGALLLPSCHAHRTPAGTTLPLAPRAKRAAERATSSTIAVVDENVVVVIDEDVSRLFVRIGDAAFTPVELESASSSVIALSRGFAIVQPAVDQVTVFSIHGSSIARVGSVHVPHEPVALARSEDERSLWVVSAAAGKVSEIALDGLRIMRIIDVPKVPRSVVAHNGMLIATHPRSGTVSKIDIKSGAIQEFALQAYVTNEKTARRSTWAVAPVVVGRRMLIPHVLAAPGDPQERTRGYGDTARSVVADIAHLDVSAAKSADSTPRTPEIVDPLDAEELTALTSRAGRLDDCVLPVAAALHESSTSLLVACRGTNELVAVAAEADVPLRAERARIRIGAGPSGIAVKNDGTVLVHEAFDRTVRELRLVRDATTNAVAIETVTTTHLHAAVSDPAWERGRALFYRVGDSRIARDGRACASCHPFGGDDGLVWSTPDGPRRTLSLNHGSSGQPLSWSGTEGDLPRRILRTTDRLGASGQLTSDELSDLATYVAKLRDSPKSHDAKDPTRISLGRLRFEQSGCSTCHAGTALSDGQRHDVGSAHLADRARAFRTPSLVGIAARGPYYHDGRYATLRELVFDRSSPMGSRATTKSEELEQLLGYLESL